MTSSTPAPARRAAFALSLLLALACSGCAVITVAGAAVGVAVTGASLAVDATVGATKAVASGVGAVLPSSKKDE